MKDHIINILGFLDHMLSITTTELCHHCAKAAINNTLKNDHEYVPIKHYLWIEIGILYNLHMHRISFDCFQPLKINLKLLAYWLYKNR